MNGHERDILAGVRHFPTGTGVGVAPLHEVGGTITDPANRLVFAVEHYAIVLRLVDDAGSLHRIGSRGLSGVP